MMVDGWFVTRTYIEVFHGISREDSLTLAVWHGHLIPNISCPMQKTKPNELAAAKMVGGRCFGVTVTVRFWMSMVDRVWGPVSILIRYLEQGTSRVTFVVPPEVSRLPPGYGILNEGNLNKCSEETVILQKKLKNLRTQQPWDRVTVTHCKGTWSFRPTTSYYHIHVSFQWIVLFWDFLGVPYFSYYPEGTVTIRSHTRMSWRSCLKGIEFSCVINGCFLDCLPLIEYLK